jgi:hypothetical protein
MKELMQASSLTRFALRAMQRMKDESFNKGFLEGLDYSHQEVNNKQRKNYD